MGREMRVEELGNGYYAEVIPVEDETSRRGGITLDPTVSIRVRKRPSGEEIQSFDYSTRGDEGLFRIMEMLKLQASVGDFGEYHWATSKDKD
jgi:hypothetical protein